MPQSVDLTELARNGKLDPTIGRDDGEWMHLVLPLLELSFLQKSVEPYRVSHVSRSR